jgi:hypothetical protein
MSDSTNPPPPRPPLKPGREGPPTSNRGLALFGAAIVVAGLIGMWSILVGDARVKGGEVVWFLVTGVGGAIFTSQWRKI